MKSIQPDVLLEQMKWRYATKVFDPTKKIPALLWNALEETLILTPSSFGLQPWKFFIVTDDEIREKLTAASWGQKQVQDCSHHVVFAIQKKTGPAEVEKYIKRIMELRGASAESQEGFKKMMLGFLAQPEDKFNVTEWAACQVYIALGNFMTAAALLGVDTCPMEGIDPVKYDEILGLTTQGYHTVVACAAGYRSADDKYATLVKVRYESKDVIQKI